MNWIKENSKIIFGNLFQYVRWVFFGTVTGAGVGLFCSLFSWCLSRAIHIRETNDYVFLFLPLGGLVIVFLYRLLDYEHNAGTDSVIESIHSSQTCISLRMAFLIFTSTIITLLFGGSVGREGAALQIGGSMGKKLGDLLHFNAKDKKIILMCGMAAAFAALFGTPMAATFFAMEVASIGVLYYAALVPCVCAALVAYEVSLLLGVQAEHFPMPAKLNITAADALRTLLLAICCAALSILFCLLLHMLQKVSRTYLTNSYIRIFAGGCLIIFLTLLLNNKDYLGTGMSIIEQALEGTALPWAFLFKMLFTAITISAGYKGGEIIPSLFIGATFGCVFGSLIGLPAPFAAAVGMAAVFCGVTNCPITSLLISFELFGFSNAGYFLVAIATSYMLSGYYSLYHTQIIVYSKFENQYINRSAK